MTWWQWVITVAFGLPVGLGLLVSVWWGLAMLILELWRWVEGGME